MSSNETIDAPITFRLLPNTIKTMGRAQRADFIVEAALVSRLHCRFGLSPEGTLTVQDLGSTNGTFVNDKKIDEARLAAGDKVRVGRVEFTVSVAEDSQPTLHSVNGGQTAG
ncbi:MAG: FHA domain-containing protein [Vicinamibacterales bacterium]